MKRHLVLLATVACVALSARSLAQAPGAPTLRTLQRGVEAPGAPTLRTLQRGVEAPGAPDAALIQKARAIHDRVIALDTHDDINPENFTRQKNYTQRLDTQVNLPKMKDGGLDAAFFIVYVGQGPLTAEGYANA